MEYEITIMVSEPTSLTEVTDSSNSLWGPALFDTSTSQMYLNL